MFSYDICIRFFNVSNLIIPFSSSNRLVHCSYLATYSYISCLLFLYHSLTIFSHNVDDLPFNRGMLFNIGYVEAQRRDSFHCFIFHGVDLVPEDDRNSYSCPEQGRPRHLSFVIDMHKYKYRLLLADKFNLLISNSLIISF